MEELINKNNQLIKEVVETLPNIQQSIDDTTKNYQYYLGSIKNEVFTIKDNETYSEAIKRGEGIFDRIDEVVRRRKLVIEKGKETVNKIKTVADKMSRIIQECTDDEETVNKAKNELIDKIIHMEEMIMKDKIRQLEEEINKVKTRFNKNKEEWEKQYSDYLERKKRLSIMRGMNTMEEIHQIEEWTNRKVGNILFDSDIDDWNDNTTVFGERIMNKEHLIIMIEDEEGNKFGGYVNEKIDKVGCFINDSQSFVFSLESNGRLEGMKKFDINQPEYAFHLYNQSDDCLFSYGDGDIFVFKENNKTYSWCKQNSFEYEGIENALCGKELPSRFTPKRIIVIQMK
ncbi:predicted protein [Entamoeba histolytica]